MDPQQRLLLEVAWEALEDAGIAAGRGSPGAATGVFVGISSSDYAQLQLHARRPEALDAYFGTGNAVSVAAGRLSYVLGCTGRAWRSTPPARRRSSRSTSPARACATGECRLALAGGVNLILTPEADDRLLARRGMLAPDGRCKTFDAAADGYVRGEGCGVVVLKRLSDAHRRRRSHPGRHPRHAPSTRTAAAAGSPRPTARRRRR